MKFIQLKDKTFAQVLKEEGEQIEIINLKGEQSTITPEQIGSQIDKWSQVLKLIIQFAQIIIAAFKKQ